jgi:hypothetical protein
LTVAQALLHGKAVGLLGIHGALRSRLHQCPQAEIERERVLHHLEVALTERVGVLEACAGPLKAVAVTLGALGALLASGASVNWPVLVVRSAGRSLTAAFSTPYLN